MDQVIRALILAPSKELCSQIHKNFSELTVKCSREVTCIDISQHFELSAQKPLLIEGPDVVVATPSRALAHLRAKNMVLNDCLEILVVDEADLVFSFGFENDVKQILRYNFTIISFIVQLPEILISFNINNLFILGFYKCMTILLKIKILKQYIINILFYTW